MKVIYKTLALLVLSLMLCGCKDFLGNVPKGYQIPTKVEEYEPVSYTHLTLPTILLV